MTREQIAERQPIFAGLAELYEKAFKGERRVEVLIGTPHIVTADGATAFKSDAALVKQMTKEICEYLTMEVEA